MIKFFLNSFLWKSVNIICSLFTGILLARNLSVSDRGEYALFISIVSLYVVILNLGIPESLVYRLNKEKQLKSQLIKYGFLISTLLFLLLLMLYNVLILFGFNILYININYAIAPFFVSLIIGSYNVLLRHLILKKNKIPLFNFLSSIETISNLLIFYLLYLTNNFSLINVIYVFIGTISFSFTVHIFSLKSDIYLYIIEKFEFNYLLIRRLFKLAIPLFLLGISGIFSTKINLFVLEYFHDYESVGYYSIAMIFPNLLLVIPSQISLLLYPVASKINDFNVLVSYGKKILSHTLFLVLISLTLACFVIPFIIPFLYGDVYKPVISTVYIIFIGVIFSGLNNVLINLLVSHGETKKLLHNSFIIIFGVFILSFLVYWYSYFGTALTFTLLSLFCFIVNFIKYRQITNFKITSLIITKQEIILLLFKLKNMFLK